MTRKELEENEKYFNNNEKDRIKTPELNKLINKLKRIK